MSRTKRPMATLLVGLMLGSVAYAQPGQTTPTAPPPSPTPVKNEPAPSGPGLGTPGTPTRTPAPAPVVVNTKPLQLNEKEMEELKDVESEYDSFVKAANAHDARMRLLARREYDSRTAELEKKFAERTSKAESDKVKRHANAIALLEKFLATHTEHEIYTPDKMYQLADLYRDEADDQVDAKLAALEASGQPASPDQPIIANYDKALFLWEDILKRFPKYRQTPATLYLLAYYGKAKDERKSLQIFLALTCANRFKWNDTPVPVPTKPEALRRAELKTLRNPYADCQSYPGADLELTRHAWVRGIADYQFAIPGELDEAIAAYLKVADTGQESKMYAESLYKLAWSYYKRDFLKDSITRFDQSVKLYDTIQAQGGTPALELRDESIQYIAVAFTDPWTGESDVDPVKALARAKEFYAGRENEAHVRDVWVAMGKAFAEIQAWDQAVDAYRIAIGPPWELNPKNPLVHQEIVNVFEAKGDKFAADAAAGELATRYAPGTAWYAANEKDREAMEAQRRIAERALYAAARNTHSAATVIRKDYEASKTKDPQLKTDYLALYTKAVDLYSTFIKTYPESDYVYEFNFFQGEALFWSEKYKEAIVQYKWVRDHRDIGVAYYIDAANSVVQSYEAAAQVEVAAGRLAALKVPTADELKALPQPMQAQPIPPIYVELQGEYDNYQNVVTNPKVAPGQGINAALISLAYLHTDDAVARFKIVMDKFCHVPPDDPKDKNSVAPAAKAKDGMLAIFLATGNLDAVEATNNSFIRNTCGDKAAQDLAIGQTRALNFTRAAKLYAEKQFIPAAEAFYRFYKTAPNTDADLPIALYNAAVSYKLGERPKTAISLFKEFTNNPAKSFRESPFYLSAMALTAASYQSAFDYTNAVKTYLDVYETTKKAKKLGIKAPDPLPGEKAMTLEAIGLDAMFNAAFASELNRDFKKAIELYGQYGKIEPDKRKQDRALWSTAGIYRQSGDINSMTETLDKWRARFGRDAGNEDDFVQSYADTSALWKRKGNTAKAKESAQLAIDGWKSHGAAKNSRGAKLAGEFQLALVEADYAAWDAFEIKTTPPSIAAFTKMGETLKTKKTAIEDKILTLDPFGVAEYSMAAKLRYGDVQYTFSIKVANLPLPKQITSVPSVLEKFQLQLDENVKKFGAEAKKQWSEVVAAAKQGGISNKWSRLALEELGREFPDEFTPLRQELIQGTDAP